METQGTGNNQAKDWRKQGLGWLPDYPDERDYLLDSDEVQKSGNLMRNSGNLRRNEVTKSIEDIAENLLELIETLERGSIRKQALRNLKTELESQIFGEIAFVKVKVYSESLRSGIHPSPKVRNLKYYLQLLSSHPKLSFQPVSFFENQSEYWKWLNSEEFDENTQKIVEAFQKKVNIRVDGIVGVETYTAIGNFLGNVNYSQPERDTSLVNLLPIPIWIGEVSFRLFLIILNAGGKFLKLTKKIGR